MVKNYIDINDNECLDKLVNALTEQIKSVNKTYDEICIACIGTDRATGDCLGPLVGYKLNGLSGVRIIGTLENPLHAKNLTEYANTIQPNQLVIAVDASLGAEEKVGHIIVKNKPSRPGSAMDKQLPQIGDISILGIINTFGSGLAELFIIQNTRLSIVMKMADLIENGLRLALSYVGNENIA